MVIVKIKGGNICRALRQRLTQYVYKTGKALTCEGVGPASSVRGPPESGGQRGYAASLR